MSVFYRGVSTVSDW